MDRVFALNALYAAADFSATASVGWILLLCLPFPRVLGVLHAGLAVASIVTVADSEFASSTLPIAVAIATKWAYPPRLLQSVRTPQI